MTLPIARAEPLCFSHVDGCQKARPCRALLAGGAKMGVGDGAASCELKAPEVSPVSRDVGKYNMNCVYCGRETFPGSRLRINHPQTRTRDHVIPLSRGGLDTKENRVIACLRCNNIKGNMMPDEWAAYMEATPMWWTLTRYQRRLRALGNPPLPMAESIMILKFGKKAWKQWKANTGSVA